MNSHAPAYDRPATPEDGLRGEVGRREERGVVAIVMAIMGMFLMGVLGLVVDSAIVSSGEQSLQVAADAAALAGANAVAYEVDPWNEKNLYHAARSAAQDAAGTNWYLAVGSTHSSTGGEGVGKNGKGRGSEGQNKNGNNSGNGNGQQNGHTDGKGFQLDPNASNDPDGDIVIGSWDPDTKEFTPETSAPNSMKITTTLSSATANGALDLFFGPLFGTDSVETSRSAIAMFKAVSAPYMTLTGEPGGDDLLRATDNGVFDASGGAVHFNTDGQIYTSGDGVIRAAVLKSTENNIPSDSGFEVANYKTGESPWDDPFTFLLPNEGQWISYRNSMPKPLGNNGQINAAGTYSPGYYPEGLIAKGNQDIVLLPGVYMFGGHGIDMAGTARVTGDKVCVLIEGRIDIKGSSWFESSAPKTGTFTGVAFHLARHLSSTSDHETIEFEVESNGTLIVTGVIYVPDHEFDVEDTAYVQTGGLVAGWCEVQDDSEFKLTGDNLPVYLGDTVGSYLVK